MKNNRFLKVLAVVMSILMMTAIAIPAFATDAGAGGDADTTLTPVDTDSTYDVWDGSYDTSPFAHITDHTQNYAEADPIIIDTAEKLAGLAKFVNDAGISNTGFNSWGAMVNQRIYITKNMDMRCIDFPIIGKHYGQAQFSGLLEGRLDGVEGAAITIANLSVPGSSGNNAGFIGTLRGGGVKNLTFLNAHVGNADTVGGQGLVVGYVSKVIQFFENITVVDSTLTAGNAANAYTGYLVGVAKVDADFTMKNCAVINCETVVNPQSTYCGGLAGILQARNTTVYTFENCFISGSSTTEAFNNMAGFVAKAEHNANVATEYVFKNCHYNANMKHGITDLDFQGILIADATAGATVSIDGLLITGAVDGMVDGAAPLFAYAGGSQFTVTAQNIYSTVDVIGVGDNATVSFEDNISVTKVDKADITGAAAATTLAGFDFTNVWTTRDDKIATLKIAVADEYDAALGEKHTHAYDTTWETDEDEHWNECECGDKANVGAHVDSDNSGACDTCDYAMEVAGGDTGDTGDTGNTGNTGNSDSNTTKKDDADKEDDGGCGSVVSATCLVTLLTVGMGVTVIRKKKD